MSNIIRGSKWRKWDLHIHSTYSIEARAKLSVKSIFKEAIAKDISVIAISDHSNVTGLDEIWSVWENESVELEGKSITIRENIQFIPAIELKANCGKRGVHFIVLMPSTVNGEKVNQQFFSENILSKIELTKTLITNAGKGNYNLGLFEIAVDLKKTSEFVHKFGGLISVHAFGKDHNFENEIEHPKTKTPSEDELLHALGEEKEVLIKNCIDICELNNDGEKAQTQANFYLKNFSKPSIICSDSHESYSGYFTWIKADTTFNGLKQIIYEPEGRVCIKKERPEDKIPYTVIDSVRFIDNRKHKEFMDEWIYLNQNLNSIIGGKSAGKSLLLYHIAKTIDPQRIECINNEKGSHKKIEYPFEIENGFDFEVKWVDGESYTLKSTKRPNRPITFIPQLYLNRLAEDQKEELNQLVNKMLIDSFDEYRIFREEIKTKIDNLKANIFSAVESYYRLKRDLEDKAKKLAEIGDKKAIEENLKLIKLKIEELRKESEFSGEEEQKYKTLTEQKQNITNEISDKTTLISALNNLKTGFISFKSEVYKIVEDRINVRVPILSSITAEDIRKKIDKMILEISEKISKTIESSISTDFSEIEQGKLDCEALDKRLKDTKKELNPFIEKVKNRSAFDEFQKKQKDENAKLKTINDTSAVINKLLEKRQTKPISDKYAELFSCYSSILTKNDNFKFIPDADNLEINSSIQFSKNKFTENFLNKVNRKKPFSEQIGSRFNDEGEYVFNTAEHLSFINLMVEDIAKGEVILRQGFDNEHAMLSLLDDYFTIDYNLLQDGDDLLSMSPGKRGIILFQLFLHLSKSINPILIDQPEDNLDNRTVYQELNDFIKAKKTKRQIIIVSHNPNLVVSTDAENIIVANQSGQNKSGQNSKYKFEYVNGALENSFKNDKAKGVLNQCGIREHVCDILEGGEEAFEKREKKYGLK